MPSADDKSSPSKVDAGRAPRNDPLSRLLKANAARTRSRLTAADRLDALAAKPADATSRGLVADAKKARHDLATLCPGTVLEDPLGRCYFVEGTIRQLLPHLADTEKEYCRTFVGGGARTIPRDLHESVRPLAQCDPADIAYLDIETCGMAGMAVFLVGLLGWRGGNLWVRQYLARDYSEEAAMLAHVWQQVAIAPVLVTFNGLAFDVPFIQDRAAVSGLGARRLESRHVDLLHEARRRWKGILPNCRLQTLEHFICGRLRLGDIPGDQIPAVYHEFVRTGDARQIQVVLRHNAQDLVTLAEVAARILLNCDAGLS